MVPETYDMPREVAHCIAVGLYHDVGTFVAAAKRSNPQDYEHFVAEYLAEQATQSQASVKRRSVHKRSAISR